MDHVTYALFDDERHAAEARDAVLSRARETASPCRVLLERGHLDEAELGILESAAPEGLRRGALVGAAFGAGLGLVAFSAAHLGWGGVLGLSLVFGVYGALCGGVAAASSVDRALEQLVPELSRGKVVVVVEAASFTELEAFDEVISAHAGIVLHP